MPPYHFLKVGLLIEAVTSALSRNENTLRQSPNNAS